MQPSATPAGATADGIAGAYFAPGGSARVRAVLRSGADGAWIEAGNGGMLAGPQSLAALEVSSRVGDTPRFIRFPDEGAFETADNAAVDALLTPLRPRHDLAHRLESRLRYVLLGLAVTVVFAWGVVRHGIPALAESAAHAVPPHLAARLGDGVLELLDGSMLGPSTLSDEEQARLRVRFEPFMRDAGGGMPLRVEFRDAADTLGPNALALPSGTVVFTDQLVQLAGSDEELIGVLAHEIGHIEHRHALRRAIQGSAVGLAATVLSGDVSSISSVVAAVPVILTELGYSRDFEFEADRHAAEVLQRHGLPPALLGSLLARLDKRHAAGCGQEAGGAHDDCHDEGWWRYLSTHPPTAERIRRLDEAGGQ
ncbi:M48 family metallopeptidase [Thauera sp. SDU_THAU2]|uniref:M48 family metallopeptidase n=1 Tax=Thauera sp. SDU_THAU2 TaxID=3136633 RepID=UPI00311E5F35